MYLLMSDKPTAFGKIAISFFFKLKYCLYEPKIIGQLLQRFLLQQGYPS
jgi:hypothetical protein